VTAYVTRSGMPSGTVPRETVNVAVSVPGSEAAGSLATTETRPGVCSSAMLAVADAGEPGA
jgi:hypothetical protein